MSNQLTKPEQTRYRELKRVIKKGQKTFVEVGLALIEIREQKLYRGEHATFDAFPTLLAALPAAWAWKRRRRGARGFEVGPRGDAERMSTDGSGQRL